MSKQYDNDDEDVVKENKKQTEAINKYIIGTLKMYISPEIFIKQRPFMLGFGCTTVCTNFHVQPNLPLANQRPPHCNKTATLIPF